MLFLTYVTILEHSDSKSKLWPVSFEQVLLKQLLKEEVARIQRESSIGASANEEEEEEEKHIASQKKSVMDVIKSLISEEKLMLWNPDELRDDMICSLFFKMHLNNNNNNNNTGRPGPSLISNLASKFWNYAEKNYTYTFFNNSKFYFQGTPSAEFEEDDEIEFEGESDSEEEMGDGEEELEIVDIHSPDPTSKKSESEKTEITRRFSTIDELVNFYGTDEGKMKMLGDSVENPTIEETSRHLILLCTDERKYCRDGLGLTHQALPTFQLLRMKQEVEVEWGFRLHEMDFVEATECKIIEAVYETYDDLRATLGGIFGVVSRYHESGDWKELDECMRKAYVGMGKLLRAIPKTDDDVAHLDKFKFLVSDGRRNEIFRVLTRKVFTELGPIDFIGRYAMSEIFPLLQEKPSCDDANNIWMWIHALSLRKLMKLDRNLINWVEPSFFLSYNSDRPVASKIKYSGNSQPLRFTISPFQMVDVKLRRKERRDVDELIEDINEYDPLDLTESAPVRRRTRKKNEEDSQWRSVFFAMKKFCSPMYNRNSHEVFKIIGQLAKVIMEVNSSPLQTLPCPIWGLEDKKPYIHDTVFSSMFEILGLSFPFMHEKKETCVVGAMLHNFKAINVQKMHTPIINPKYLDLKINKVLVKFCEDPGANRVRTALNQLITEAGTWKVMFRSAAEGLQEVEEVLKRCFAVNLNFDVFFPEIFRVLLGFREGFKMQLGLFEEEMLE